MGSTIQVSILITANHVGFFKFALCNLDSSRRETDDCFVNNKIKLARGDDHFVVQPNMLGVVKMDLKLPDNLICSHCVLQWTYVTGNIMFLLSGTTNYILQCLFSYNSKFLGILWKWNWCIRMWSTRTFSNMLRHSNNGCKF